MNILAFCGRKNEIKKVGDIVYFIIILVFLLSLPIFRPEQQEQLEGLARWLARGETMVANYVDCGWVILC